MKVNTQFLLEVFKLEYSNRLNEVIGEADAFDKKGNVILSPDLKVRHKNSGFEYTIDHVEGDKGTLQIFLRQPEEPRFEPPADGAEVLGGLEDIEQLEEQDDTILDSEEQQEPQEEVVFVIDQAEFEKEYEVD